MKKFFTLVFIVVMMCSNAHAQLVGMLAGAIKNAVPVYTPGMITYKDGHTTEYLWVEMPKSGMTDVRVSNDAKHKKPDTIDAEDIFSITYWTVDFPENKLTLFPLHADDSEVPFTSTLPRAVWGYPIAGSEWGIVFKCNPKYDLDKKSGDIVLDYNTRAVQNGQWVRYEEVAACCYLVCRDFKNAQLIGGSGSADGKKMNWIHFRMKYITPFFASNPALQARIADKQLGAGDIQYILDEMAIFHGMKSVTDAPEAVEEQSAEVVTNGTIGDDE